MTALYHFWSAPCSQRVRLALGYKGVPYEDKPLSYHDDETFFELGVARHAPVLVLDSGTVLTDAVDILWRIDALFPQTPPLVTDIIDESAWRALLTWRERVDAVLERLYAPCRPAYRDIGDDDEAMACYKSEIQHRYGMSVEALANDRYDGYSQLASMSRLPELARYLAERRFYMGVPSVADALLAADLYPLQLLDGVSLPVDLMYYLRRVEETYRTSLREGLLVPL